MTRPASLLIVEADPEFGRLLLAEADARAYRARAVASVSEALDLVEREPFDAMLVDLAPGAETAFDLLSRLKQMTCDAEIIVMSDRASMAATIQWFDPNAFAFVRRSDLAQVFATLARAIERRRMMTHNRRLVWELQTINGIASDISRSLELEDVLTGALHRLVRAMDAAAGAIRLRDELSGAFEERAAVGPSAERAQQEAPSPSDQVIATRAPVIVEDVVATASGGEHRLFGLRSAISVPMLAGDELVGTLSLASAKPGRFGLADQHLLGIIAAQIVVAIQNARLHYSIRRAKREWERTFDAISDPIAVFDNRGELLRGNRALAARLALPITGIRRLACREVGFCGAEESCAGCAITRALKGQESRAEVTLPSGQIFSVTTFPVAFAGDGVSVVQVAKNVTEEIHSARRLQRMSSELAGANERITAALDCLKSTQAQLVQAEKLSAIGQLVAGVAHELNNPLTSVMGFAQLLEEEMRQGPVTRPAHEVASDLRLISQEAERAARIIRNLLAFARRQGTARAPQELVDLCSRVLELRAYGFRIGGVDVRTDLPDGLPPIFADGGQLQQVLLNLVLNAEQAMAASPLRRLSIAARYDEAVHAVELAVTDSGHGIDEANLSRIFDPFFTTREVGEGTGLGLSICYGIVRDHGGHIHVDSRPGTGTTFRVVLPALDRDLHRSEAGVLVANADQSEREFIAAALGGWGYRVTAAGSLQEALDRYSQPGLQIAFVDRGILTADLDAWQARCAADAGRHLRIVVTSIVPEDRRLERFCRDRGAMLLAAPADLRALHGALRLALKECV